MNALILKICCCFFFLQVSLNVYAQTQWIDSIKKVLITQKDDSGKVASLLNISDAYRFVFPDSALTYAEQALLLAQKINDDEVILRSLCAISGSLYILGNYNRELEYTFKVLALSKKMNTPYSIGYSNGLLSDCYYNLGEYDTCLHYWRKVVKIAETSLPDELFSVYGNSSHIFAAMQQYDSAMLYAEKSIDHMNAMPWFNKDDYTAKWARSCIFEGLAEAFAGKAYYDSAFFYYRTSLAFSAQIQMALNEMDAYNGLAKLYKEKNNPDSAIWYAKKAINVKISNNYPVSMLKAVNILTACYESKKNADSSLRYLHIAISIKDSLFNRGKAMVFQHLLFTEQEKQNQATTATLQLQRRYRTYLFIVLLIVLLAVASIIIRNRRIKQMQQMRNSIADDLHDDIGSTLSSISIMSELAKAKSPEAAPLLVAITESTGVMQESMSDIVWAVNPQNDRFENVLQRMNLFAAEILDAKNIGLAFSSDASLSGCRFTMKQRKNLYLFFKEAINNAAKYSKAEQVSVNISKTENQVEMTITDNGNGFDTTSILNGNGMNTFKKRVKELNARFAINSAINKGTTVQLKFKIT
jgi:two-component system, NarL family, sensor histidine kinase UhpB